MRAHLVALAQVLALVLATVLSSVGWGTVAAKALSVERSGARGLLLVSWLGWSFTLLLLQILHLFAPLIARTVVPLFLVGIGLAMPLLRRRAQGLLAARRRLLGLASGVCLLALLTAWVASRAMVRPDTYDLGLYHHNVIQWTNSYPVVPGLGNLHTRLAFNQASFLHVASLNLHPHFGQGRVVAISYLLVLLVATVIGPLVAREHGNGAPGGAAVLGRDCAWLLLPVTTYLVLFAPGLSAATPDDVSAMLQIAIFAFLCRAIGLRRAGHEVQGTMRALGFLAATAITVKLTNLAFAAPVIGIALAWTWQQGRGLRRAAEVLWLPAVVGLVWAGRGVVLSGMPLFPSVIGRLPVDWAVPREQAIDTANWIYSWARLPGVHWREVLGRWDWFGPWIESARGRLAELVGPLLVLAVVTVGLALLVGRRAAGWDRREILIVLPPLSGVVFWFLVAPNPRFLGSQLWLTVVAAALLLVSRFRSCVSARWGGALLSSLALMLLLPFAIEFGRSGARPRASWSGFQQVPKVPLRVVTNIQRVKFRVPRSGDQCWDAPLPCAPSVDATLLLRDIRSFGAGFRRTPDDRRRTSRTGEAR